MIDKEGYRYNVGIIIVNDHGALLWGRRVGNRDAWQFPQGGMVKGETPKEAMYRELEEELGLMPNDVAYIAETQDWISYLLPKKYIRYDRQPLCIGQKQKWFLLRLLGNEDRIRLNLADNPEFDAWRWVDYWHPVDEVIEFKRDVYQKTLREFEPIVKQIVDTQK